MNDDIALEAALLKVLTKKDSYESFSNVLDRKRLLIPTSNLIRDFGLYYDKYNSDIDWDVFCYEFCHNWHRRDMPDEEITYYKTTVFPIVQKAVVDDKLLMSLLERETAHKISEALDKGFNQETINELLQELQQKKSIYNKIVDEDVFRLIDVDLAKIDSSNGVSWFSTKLQGALSNLMPGQFILVPADSNVGKSAFCITQTVHALKHKFDRPILYCTSEDTKEDLSARILSNLYCDRLPGGFDQVIEQREKVFKQYEKSYDPDMFKAMQIGTLNDLPKIESKIEKYNPCLVVIDMLDVLSGSLDIKDLTKTYNRVRKIANSGVPVIGTTQAGNTSYWDSEKCAYVHRKWLTEKDTAGSKGGGKQGAAYAMLSIGKSDDNPNLRYLTTTKRKRGKDVRVVFELDEAHSLYKEIL